MTEVSVAHPDPAFGGFFARWRALRVADEEGWLELVGADPRIDRCAVDLAADPAGRKLRRRFMYRDEMFWWVLGLGDGHGFGELVLERPDWIPDIYTLEQAADKLHMTVDGVKYRIRAGHLHPIFPRGVQELWAPEVDAAADPSDAAAASLLARVRQVWAPLPPLPDLPEPGRPVELAVPTSMPAGVRQIHAMEQASAAGLIRYLWVDGERYAASVTVDGQTTTRYLLVDAVLPWLQGVADARHRSEVVTYRQGLL